jgi:hypothetical protein
MHRQESDFKYDLAFSFTFEDEPLAKQLFNLLKERISCFIYFEEQKKLAGRDGEDVFNKVFSIESRVVAILYSQEWGDTKWTRIEQTAIRNRGYEEGYDFVIFIPTKNNLTPPKWLPKNRIWVGLERWGIEGAASSIESKVLELNGIIKSESIADQVVRAEREIREKVDREGILDSEHGLRLAFEEMKVIIAEVLRYESEIKTRSTDWHFRAVENDGNGIDIISHGYFLTFRFQQKFANSTKGARLMIGLWNGVFDIRGNAIDPLSKNENISISHLRFDIDRFNQNGWTDQERESFISSSKLVDKWVRELIKIVREKRKFESL